MAPTPEWAVFDSAQAGFDPAQQRVKKERRHPGSSRGTAVAGEDGAVDEV